MEIEILVELLGNYEEALEVLRRYEFVGTYQSLDVYYYDPLRSQLKPNLESKIFSCFRLRKKGNKTALTYKNDYYDNDKWLYSDEYETSLDDYDSMVDIINCLGYKKLLALDIEKNIFMHNEYEIVLEKVDQLGCFLEVELKSKRDITNPLIEKDKIWAFICDLGLSISDELNSGKPELFIKKNKIIVE